MNDFERLPLASFQSICRTCLAYGELFTICEINWEGIELKDVMVNRILNIQIKDDDPLPRHMCRNCIKMMYKMYHFILQCQKSEMILRKVLINSTKNQNVKEAEYKQKPSAVEIADESKDSDLDVDPVGRWHDIKSAIESDTDIQVDDCADVEKKAPDCDEPAVGTNAEGNIVQQINTIKEQITKMKVKNEVRLRQMAKVQLLDFNSLPNKQRSSVLRRGAPGPLKPVMQLPVDEKSPTYVCITCKSSFQTHEELKRHKIDTKHKKSFNYKCDYCDKRCDSNQRLQEHTRTHTGEKPNKCPTCGQCFNGITDLKRHIRALHMEVKPYICRFCKKDFSRKQYLADHERTHTGEKLLCPYCGKGFHSYTCLYHHEKTHKGHERTHKGQKRTHKGQERTHKGPDGIPITKDKLYQCHLCDKTVLTESNLKVHILLHGPKNFSCEICRRTYVTENRLQNHIKVAHQENKNKFACHLCKKEYKQKDALKMHLRAHSGEDYPCHECGKRFVCRGSLHQHRRVHTGDTKYQCKECFLICVNKRNLEGHLRTHTGEKPFACEYCGKCFAQNANLNAHLKIHTEEKNHLCKICNKAFCVIRGLKKHMAIHEKNGDIV